MRRSNAPRSPGPAARTRIPAQRYPGATLRGCTSRRSSAGRALHSQGSAAFERIGLEAGGITRICSGFRRSRSARRLVVRGRFRASLGTACSISAV
jgi:hypothetical protein